MTHNPNHLTSIVLITGIAILSVFAAMVQQEKFEARQALINQEMQHG